MKGQGIQNPPGLLLKRLFSLKDAARYLGRSTGSLRETIWRGDIPYVRDGRRIFLDIRDLDEFIEKNKTRFTH